MGIRVANLVKTYGPATIVHGISFTVDDGEFVTLLGPSGCGKTTTLRCIAGLERTNGGVIEIDGQVVSDAQHDIFVPPHERNLGMVFQSYAIWPHMTVADNVAFPLVVQGKRDTAEAVAWALDVVGLSALAKRHPSEISGGQQQRVALARAIVGRPKVLLFDEPLSNLDARLRDRTRGEISRIQKELSIPAVYVTHDQAEALSMSDRIIVMDAGRIVEEGKPDEILFTSDRPAGSRQISSVRPTSCRWSIGIKPGSHRTDRRYVLPIPSLGTPVRHVKRCCVRSSSASVLPTMPYRMAASMRCAGRLRACNTWARILNTRSTSAACH